MIRLSKRYHFWLHGLLSAFIGGGATAVTGMVTVPESINLKGGLDGGFGNLLEMWCISGVINAFFYLKQSPLPQLSEGDTRIFVRTPDKKAVVEAAKDLQSAVDKMDSHAVTVATVTPAVVPAAEKPTTT